MEVQGSPQTPISSRYITVSEDDDLPPMIDWSPTPRSARLSSSTSTISGSVATDNQYSSGSRTCTASSLPTLYPTCPTCNMQFPLSEIEVHADTCCENIRNPETCLYESIMISSRCRGVEFKASRHKFSQ